jgi:predicted Zn-dependent protease
LLKLDREEEAKAELKELESKFPKSLRLSKLKALLLEFQGKLEEAKQLYMEISADGADSSCMKRLYVIEKDSGHIEKAAALLEEYLSKNSCDIEGWHEYASINGKLKR